MKYTFTVPGRPKPKERPRATRSGAIYTPRSTREYEQHIAACYEGPRFVGPVEGSVVYAVEGQTILIRDRTWTSPLRGDIDTYIKATLDGLVLAGAGQNDSRVMAVRAEKQ